MQLVNFMPGPDDGDDIQTLTIATTTFIDNKNNYADGGGNAGTLYEGESGLGAGSTLGFGSGASYSFFDFTS